MNAELLLAHNQYRARHAGVTSAVARAVHAARRGRGFGAKKRLAKLGAAAELYVPLEFNASLAWAANEFAKKCTAT